MKYETFLARAIDEMRGRFPHADIRMQAVSKLQGESYTGMTVRPENSDVGATLNLQDFYEALGAGLSEAAVMDQIEHAVDTAIRHMPHYDARMLADYDRMKDSLTIELVPVLGNEEKLSQIPHRNVEDMAIVYRFEVESHAQAAASILVTNDMLGAYAITADQLHADAVAAAVQKHPAKLQNLQDAVREMMGDSAEAFPEKAPSPLWVATVDGGQYGAGVIQYPGFLDQAAETLGGDFYVLPVSIHEVLLVADNGSMERSGLAEMVRSIHREEIDPAERLSANVYHYDRGAHIFEDARTFEAREAGKEAAVPADETLDKASAADLPQNTIRVLLVEPDAYPKVVEIGTELEDLQKAVGGNIEVVYPFADPVGLIVNEEGKINGMPLNRALRDADNAIYDIVAGPFLVAGLTEDRFGSLSEEQIRTFEARFHQPEAFIRMGHSIMALPIPDEVLNACAASEERDDSRVKPKHKVSDRDRH